MVRRSPVIVITGTPGTGKSTHAELLVQQLLVQESPIPLQHLNVGEMVKTQGLHEGFDDEWQSYTVDEDKVRSPSLSPWLPPPTVGLARAHATQLLDQLEPIVSQGGVVLDWHACDVYPERWADLVVVLRCHHTTLWERLEKRCVLFPRGGCPLPQVWFACPIPLAIHGVYGGHSVSSKR